MTSAVQDRLLQDGYRRCAEITRRNGTTYYWGVQLLPRERRRHVHAVYALCRLADDIVDDQAATAGRSAAEIGSQLADFAADFRRAVTDGSADPVLAAVGHTVRTVGIAPECFDRFYGAMAMDLTTTRYETWDDLLGYMEGSAAVIGEMMLPMLQPLGPEAFAPARALGFAFQYTNFLRDVAEDLDRGRIYLPQDQLRRFGVKPVDLGRRRVTPQWRAFLAHEIDRARELYRAADRGLPFLPPRSARCVGTARVLYSRILDRIEAADYDVFRTRARVPTWRKAGTAARILVTGP
ncbi:phytoene/squalene synthase family protein [Nakamurella multipartita]|jgi:phytoene synthase|uniref:Phytoene synthase n=1 Tax=Nakamurella multipartita (strain ATCC 700099 / DSM 44233 / CIP 104796 / JCM 9543 / NBRC 105858 / Y-104) TaxID=479431 RepID=C8X6L3_NAKMY|nr:phytoene/squalene synthase family protein [Nakamurella multipartita]ACV78868.1 Phytoene synthase [Nakamurella multipartita DSM 44233]